MSNTFNKSDFVGASEGKLQATNPLAHTFHNKYVPPYSVTKDTNLNNADRSNTVENLYQYLSTAVIQAWAQTESLVGKEIRRHGINKQLINPEQIRQDCLSVYQRAIDIYAQKSSPSVLMQAIAPLLGNIRAYNASVEPRLIALAAMQFHYTGQILLQGVTSSEQEVLNSYLKVIDDCLYIPLQRAYKAAANYDSQSPILLTVQQLLPKSSEIAIKICDRVIKLYPGYQSLSGTLAQPQVKIASVRDVEIFQTYLWVCVLEQNSSAIEDELFPLCLMLYPTLKVSWELVAIMLHLLGKEIRLHLSLEQYNIFLPYFQLLQEMFSPQTFPESLD